MITKKTSHKNFCELAEIYKKSLQNINFRIKKLEDTEEKTELEILRSMARNLKETIKELENYYKSDYWRNEKITMNSKKTVKIYFNV